MVSSLYDFEANFSNAAIFFSSKKEEGPSSISIISVFSLVNSFTDSFIVSGIFSCNFSCDFERSDPCFNCKTRRNGACES